MAHSWQRKKFDWRTEISLITYTYTAFYENENEQRAVCWVYYQNGYLWSDHLQRQQRRYFDDENECASASSSELSLSGSTQLLSRSPNKVQLLLAFWLLCLFVLIKIAHWRSAFHVHKHTAHLPSFSSSSDLAREHEINFKLEKYKVFFNLDLYQNKKKRTRACHCLRGNSHCDPLPASKDT